MEQKDLLIAINELAAKIKSIESHILSQSSKTYSTQETAEWIGVTPKTLSKYRSSGKITYFQIDSKVRFERQDIQNFLSNHKRNAA